MEHEQYIKKLLPPLAIRILLLAVAYFVGGSAGLSVPYVGSNITLFWPPSGIALAAMLLWGLSCWPGVFLDAFATNLYFWTRLPQIYLSASFPRWLRWQSVQVIPQEPY